MFELTVFVSVDLYMYHVGFVNKVEMLNCKEVFLHFSFSKGSKRCHAFQFVADRLSALYKAFG